ncbi:hypothetical protein PR003_g421 [Phytophthora rubi]|uniref:Uncharacterized protein n=1 Tax=Phytophthora rubi TaxID=129364 RepID=A0A6A3NRQ3_9STRA|nr:hypothetical protein PR002_g1994 [Phytophthora rubi]KAE9360070.1 hypothetical protein PR003_g421 [Phytophthora rubi]
MRILSLCFLPSMMCARWQTTALCRRRGGGVKVDGKPWIPAAAMDSLVRVL